MRQVVLDTETTGLSPKNGHKLTEIGCVELIDRKLTGNDFHTYLNPERELDEGAARITGLSYEFLKDKPLFADVVVDFLNYIKGSQLIIHNAPFDVGFLDAELKMWDRTSLLLEDYASVLDTLEMARKMYPGQRNNLDALCSRLNIDNTKRDYHGALLDAQILANVYLAMTQGQASLTLESRENIDIESKSESQLTNDVAVTESRHVPLYNATPEELISHKKFVDKLCKGDLEDSLWSK